MRKALDFGGGEPVYINMKVKAQQNGRRKSFKILLDYPIKMAKKQPADFLQPVPRQSATA